MTDESQAVRSSRGLNMGTFMGMLPFMLTVVCLFGSCIMYISALDAKTDRNVENINAVRSDMKEVEGRTNARINELSRRNDTQYQNIRSDMQEVNRKLDQLLMSGRNK